jgi:hypothetical protein
MNKKLLFSAMLVSSTMAMAAAATGTPGAGVLMFDGTNQQVNTGEDCMYEYDDACGEASTMGYWYDYDDRKQNSGDSYTLYPYEPDEYGSFIQPMIDDVGYIYIKQVTGTAYEYSFAGFGFNIVGGTQTPADITAWTGVCVTYTSDKPVYLELGADALITDYNAFRIKLDAATTPTVVSATWDQFACDATWGSCKDKTYTISQVTAAAQAIKIKIEGKGKIVENELRIFQVGTAGACSATAATVKTEATPFCKSDGDGSFIASSCVSAIPSAKSASRVSANLVGRTLSFSGSVAGASVEIISLQGQVMIRSVLSTNNLNLSSLNAGVYMVRVAGRSVNMNQKILLK